MKSPNGNPSLQLALAMAVATIGAAAFVRSQASVVPMDLKPGLWMVTDVIQGSGGGSPTMPDTSGMSDTEKKMAASMMQKMQQAQAPHKDEICIGKDQGTKPVFQPDFPENPNCKRHAVKGSAESQDSTFDCAGSTPRSGTLHVDRDTDEAAHGTGTIDMKSVNASYNFTFTAKWLRAECKTK